MLSALPPRPGDYVSESVCPDTPPHAHSPRSWSHVHNLTNAAQHPVFSSRGAGKSESPIANPVRWRQSVSSARAIQSHRRTIHSLVDCQSSLAAGNHVCRAQSAITSIVKSCPRPREITSSLRSTINARRVPSILFDYNHAMSTGNQVSSRRSAAHRRSRSSSVARPRPRLQPSRPPGGGWRRYHAIREVRLQAAAEAPAEVRRPVRPPPTTPPPPRL